MNEELQNFVYPKQYLFTLFGIGNFLKYTYKDKIRVGIYDLETLPYLDFVLNGILYWYEPTNFGKSHSFKWSDGTNIPREISDENLDVLLEKFVNYVKKDSEKVQTL